MVFRHALWYIEMWTASCVHVLANPHWGTSRPPCVYYSAGRCFSPDVINQCSCIAWTHLYGFVGKSTNYLYLAICGRKHMDTSVLNFYTISVIILLTQIPLVGAASLGQDCQVRKLFDRFAAAVPLCVLKCVWVRVLELCVPLTHLMPSYIERYT